MTLINQCVENRRPFFFFFDHIKLWRKLWDFPLLLWSTQNRRCLIFELTPGPRLAHGAAGGGRWVAYDRYFSNPAKILEKIAQPNRIIEDALYNIRDPYVVFEVEYLERTGQEGWRQRQSNLMRLA